MTHKEIVIAISLSVISFLLGYIVSRVISLLEIEKENRGDEF